MATSAPIGSIDSPIVDSDAAVDADLAAAVDPGGLRREVFGFLPYWELTDSSTRLDWEKLSTIAYFGVGAAADGDLAAQEQRRLDDGRLERLDELEADRRHQRRPRPRHAGRPHGPELRLDLEPGRPPEGAPRQLRRPAEPRPPDRSRRPRPGRRRRQPRLRAHRLGLCRRVHAAGQDRSASELNRVARGYQLTFDTTGWIGNYPIQAATGSKAADAVVVMGYDYRTRRNARVGSVAPIGRADLRHPRHDRRIRVAHPGLAGHPGRAVLRPRLVDDSASLNARNISGTKYGASTTVVYGTAAEYAKDHGRKYDPVEGVAWTAYKRQNCTGDLRLRHPWRQIYYDDVRALGAKYDLVIEVQPARRRDLGARLRRHPAGAVPAAEGQVHHRHRAAGDHARRRSASASFSPNGDGRQDTVTMNVAVTGHLRFGYAVQPYVDNVGRHGGPLRDGREQERDLHLGRPESRRRGRLPDGPYRITIWTADASNNRASVQKVVTVDTRPAVITSSVVAGLDLAQWRPARSTRPGSGWRRTRPSRARAASSGRGGATVRVWAMTGRAHRVLDVGRARMRPARSSRIGRYTFRVEGFDAARNRTVVDTPGPRRPDDPSRSPGARPRSGRAAAGRHGSPSRSSGRRPCPSRSTRARRYVRTHLDEQVRSPPGRIPLDVERPDARPALGCQPGIVPGGRDRDQLDRDVESRAGTVTVAQ